MTPLTAERVRYIKAGLDRGHTLRKIAAELLISPQYVSTLKVAHIGKDYVTLAKRAVLTLRWKEVHKIGDIGKRAVEETEAL